MIYRVKHGATVLDFGSMPAVHQFLDNYPPHIREQVLVKDISSVEINQSIEKLTTDLRRATRYDPKGEPISSTHTEWLLSRIEFYQQTLETVQRAEAELAAKEASRISQVWQGGSQPAVNEVWRE